MQKINLAVFAFLIFALASAFPETLSEISSAKIPLGQGEQEISIEESGGENWKPLFFAIDEKAYIHIPDFYKGRIAVYDKTGKFVSFIKCPQGISPRMNWFDRSPQGYYVSFNDNFIWCLNADGSVKWKYEFGYGVLPSRIILTESAVFLMLPSHIDTDGRAILFMYSSSQPLGRFGTTVSGKNIPLIQGPEQILFTALLSDMALLPEMKGKFQAPGKGMLLDFDSKGTSLWSERKETTETIYRFSPAGILEKQGIIYFPQSGLPGTGFATVCDSSLVVYKNYYIKEQSGRQFMVITGYQFK